MDANLSHSQYFELIKELEVDIALDSESFSVRLQFFRAVGQEDRYRCRIWRMEFFRIQPTFPQNDDGSPRHGSSDEWIMIDWGHFLSKKYSDFHAQSLDDAIMAVTSELQDRIEKIDLQGTS